MTSLKRWHQNNEDYLAKALNWLRLRLIGYLLQQQNEESIGHADTATPTEETEATNQAQNQAQLEKAAKALAKAETRKPSPALIQLAQRIGLSQFEQNLLLLCAAMELDTSIPDLCAQVQGNAHRPYPTFALALSIFDDPAWDVLSPEGPLRYWRLIEITQPGAQPLTTSALRIDERVINYIKGLNYLDDRLTPLVTLFAPIESDEELPPSQQTVVRMIEQQLQESSTSALPIIQLLGADSESKCLIADRAAQILDLQLYRLTANLLPTQTTDLDHFIRLWQRESILLPIALYLDAHTVEATHSEIALIDRVLSRCQSLIFLDTREPWSELDRETVLLDVMRPTPAEQQAVWLQVLGAGAIEPSRQLASQFNLNLATIHRTAQQTLKHSADQKTLSTRLWQACLMHSRPRLSRLAQRLEPKATWDTIVLPENELATLHQVSDQVRQRYRVYEEWGFQQQMNRGFGISALFSGESGTGKTMAAEVIANDLQLDLYRIDLSAVVSKYIGETEKNLRQLFDAAEDGGAILFFDEADALFGKRSEVKDSHDRYANIEINYLLQRMEAYRGLAILATNMRNALDRAFTRRLRFMINFPFPGLAERQAIWQKAFPPETPLGELDYSHLARFNLAGGSIHNIALNAAFMAAQANTPVSMSLLLSAIRTEFQKLERPISEARLAMKTVGGRR